jgi:hypothetical protein
MEEEDEAVCVSAGTAEVVRGTTLICFTSSSSELLSSIGPMRTILQLTRGGSYSERAHVRCKYFNPEGGGRRPSSSKLV